MIYATVAIGLDVGGTTIDAGAVAASGKLVGSLLEAVSPSKLSLNAQQTTASFASLIRNAGGQAAVQGMDVSAYGIAMPGPFDYERGISHMKHKFAGIFGQDIKTPLKRQLDGKPIYFVNDADAFGLGVGWLEYPAEAELWAITLGTGIGSTIIRGGRIARPKAFDSPNEAEIWNTPFRGGVLEDAISTEGFVAAYVSRGGKRGTDVKTILSRARGGEEMAKAAVRDFGYSLGEGLAAVGARFKPTRIVFGGRIREGLDVFGPYFAEAFKAKAGHEVPFSKSELRHAAVYGAARYAAQMAAAIPSGLRGQP